MLIGDLRRILKCAVFQKENRILLLLDELDPPSRVELHECINIFVDIGFECRHFHGDFTISHVGHYPDLVSIAAHVIVNGLDQSVLEEDIVAFLNWITLMVILRLPRFLFMSGRNRSWPLREIIYLPILEQTLGIVSRVELCRIYLYLPRCKLEDSA